MGARSPRKSDRSHEAEPSVNTGRSRSALVLCIVFAAMSLLWLCFIFSNSLKSADASSQDSGRLLLFMQKIFPSMSDHVLRKLAHFIEFAVLGVLASLAIVYRLKLRRLRADDNAPVKLFPAVLILAAFGVLCPVIDELLQLFSPGRSTEFLDMLIDFSGFALGALVVAAVAGIAHFKGARRGD